MSESGSDVSSSSKSSAPTINPEDDLAGCVKCLIQLREETTKLSIAIKERKKRMTAISSTILKLMQNKELKVLQLAQGRNGYLIDAETSKAKPLSKKYLTEKIIEYFKDDAELAKQLIDFLNDSREKVTKRELKFKKGDAGPPAVEP